MSDHALSAIKTVEERALLSLYREHDLVVRLRTQLINGLRELVAEGGFYISKGLTRVIWFAKDITLSEALDFPNMATRQSATSLCTGGLAGVRRA